MAETVQVDRFAVYGVTAAVVVAVDRRGSARVACFEDVGFFAPAPDVEGLGCAAHFVCIIFRLSDIFSEILECRILLGWLGVLLIGARSFRFE